MQNKKFDSKLYNKSSNKFLEILVLFVFSLSFFSCQAEQNDKVDNQVYTNSNIDDSYFLLTQNNIANSRQNAITKTIASCSPAVVGINVTEVHKVQYQSRLEQFFAENFFGERRPRKYEVKGLGSGFIISPDGYILTNHHVAGSASKIVVTLTNGEKYDAEIIGADMISDVCLLKIKGKNLPFIKFANSDNVIIGEWVIAFGNPFGLFDINAKPTVTVGVISNKGINFVQNENTFGNQEYRVYKDMLQTDAAISSGNSGGPLVNALGEVVGMNTVIFSTATSNSGAGSIGIGFSIPINRVKTIIDILKSGKKIERNTYTGIDAREITSEISQYYKLSRNEGVFIYQMDRRSPALEAGIEPGDIIDKINNKKINRIDDFLIEIGDAMVGDKLKFEIIRGTSHHTYTITVKSL